MVYWKSCIDPLVYAELFVRVLDSLQVTSELVTSESVRVLQEREMEVEVMAVTSTVG